jgi:hypothetical protein
MTQHPTTLAVLKRGEAQLRTGRPCLVEIRPREQRDPDASIKNVTRRDAEGTTLGPVCPSQSQPGLYRRRAREAEPTSQKPECNRRATEFADLDSRLGRQQISAQYRKRRPRLAVTLAGSPSTKPPENPAPWWYEEGRMPVKVFGSPGRAWLDDAVQHSERFAFKKVNASPAFAVNS